MIVLHHLEQSRSQRLIWLLEELSLPYELVRYSRDPVTRLAPPELKNVHPLGKSPLLDDAGRIVAETGMIVDYLCARYDCARRLSPAADATDDAALMWRYWLHYSEGSAMPALSHKLLLQGIEPGATEGVARTFVDPQLRLHADHWEQSLKGGEWLVGGSFSAADIVMSFPIEVALARYGDTLGERPVLTSYIRRLRDRQAFQRALSRGE